MATHIKLAQIDWDSVRMLNITGHHLEVVTEIGTFDFRFSSSEKLSEALLILALQSTKRVEYVDDCRFNPRMFV